MIDLNQIISAALTQAVEDALKPLRNQIQYLAEQVSQIRSTAPKIDFDLASTDFIGAVEAVAERVHKDLLVDLDNFPRLSEQIEGIADKRINHQISDLSDVSSFNDSVRDVVAELFNDEGKDLIEEHVESIIEDYDFSGKIEDVDLRDQVRSALQDVSFTVTVD